MAETIVKWAARFEYGKGNLARIAIDSQTKKTYHVAKCEKVAGWFSFGKRTSTDTYPVFDTSREAIVWLVAEATHAREQAERKVAEARAVEAEMAELLDVADQYEAASLTAAQGAE